MSTQTGGERQGRGRVPREGKGQPPLEENGERKRGGMGEKESESDESGGDGGVRREEQRWVSVTSR